MTHHLAFLTLSVMFFYYAPLPCFLFFFFLMIRRPPRSTLDRSSAASDVYKRQVDDAQVDLVAHIDLEQGVLERLDRAGHVALDDERCLLYTSPSPRDRTRSRMPSSA